MSAIAPQVQAVLDLYAGPLNAVQFADIDGESLRRLAAEVESAAAEVEAHQAALEGLRRTLNERQEQLLAQAQRALAYARVYAETDEELNARVASISLPRAAKRPKAEKVAAAESAEARAPDASAERGASRDASAEVTTPMSDVAPPPAVQRRGKRRESTRSVSSEDVGIDGSV